MSSKPFRRAEGFTLIELTMVVILLGVILSFTIPRVEDITLGDTLKTAVRRMTAKTRELRYMAIKDHQEYTLKYSFGMKKFWTDSPDFSPDERLSAKEETFSLPSNVDVIDICFKSGETRNDGEVNITFSKEGYISPSVIHLGSEDSRQFTFVLSPFLGKANAQEGYINIEDVRM
jgi:prepilin-type N-terminal cleavage/methylation domain-containing protein